MALSDINGKGDPWSCGGLMLQGRGMLEGLGRGGWVGEHPHKGKEEGGEGSCGEKRKKKDKALQPFFNISTFL